MSSQVRHIRATAVEPEYLNLTIARNDDGEWEGGMLDLEIANVLLIDGNGTRHTAICNVTVNLMRSDLENIAEAIDDARVDRAERKADSQIL